MTRARLSSDASFWTAAAVVVVSLWASGAPAMVYPLYTTQWALTPVATTSIFAAYPVSLVVVLVVFGGISDNIGRRTTLLIGLSVIVVGSAVFASAGDIGWLLTGRILQGLGVGLAISPAGAALVEYSPGGNTARASAVNTAATAVGTAIALLLGGALVQYAPWPSHLTFWVLVAFSSAVLTAVWFMPRASETAEGKWRPRPVGVPRGIRFAFACGALAVTAAFAMGALFLSLGAQIAKELIGTENVFVAAMVLSAWAITVGIASTIARALSPKITIIAGGILSLIGLLLLVAASAESSLSIFLIAAVLSGAGYGLLFLGGLTLINLNTPVQHRAGTLAVMYLIAYLVQGATAVSIGLTATVAGLSSAVTMWVPLIGAACIAASAVAAIVIRKRRL
jgi:predicted MFS family arabinose efflux permease